MIKSWQAFVITICSLLGAYILATFYVTAPFVALCTAIGTIFTAYIGKRLLQKKGEYHD